MATGIGNYATVQNLEGPGTVSFEVQADGYWTLTIVTVDD